jgi:hypothetical protein
VYQSVRIMKYEWFEQIKDKKKVNSGDIMGKGKKMHLCVLPFLKDTCLLVLSFITRNNLIGCA